MRVRFGHFNIRDLSLGKLSDPSHPQVRAAAAIIRKMRPDVLSINEMEHDPFAPGAFSENFFEKGKDAIFYPHRAVFPTNSGMPTGYAPPFDLKGYGLYRGQYSIALLSAFPIIEDGIKSFLDLPWNTLPEECLSMEADIIPPDYPVMSTNMLDVPIRVQDEKVHLILLHATPPIRGLINTLRNSDQLCVLSRYVQGLPLPGVEPPEKGPFVIMGDLNADCEKGGRAKKTMNELLENPGIHPVKPLKDTYLEGGGVEDPALSPDGLRLKLDYILPSKEFKHIDAGVFWPEDKEWWITARRASDHFFIYVDCEI